MDATKSLWPVGPKATLRSFFGVLLAVSPVRLIERSVGEELDCLRARAEGRDHTEMMLLAGTSDMDDSQTASRRSSCDEPKGPLGRRLRQC